MFTLENATIASVQAAVSRGELSYRKLAMMYLERIAQIDSCKGGFNSVLEVNPDALPLAEAMDNERRQGKIRGPLHGIPILLKDNIDTADKMQTTAGALALAGHFAKKDAKIVKHLRKAGCVILGKANMTEFANYMTEDMPNGYSSRGGQVISTISPETDASGSSTGSAVAVAANLCVVSVGTETCGSIISPAMVQEIVGIKPTAGLVNGKGIIPISATLDTAGPMARTVEDCVLLLEGLTGRSYSQYLQAEGLKGLRVGVYNKEEPRTEILAALTQSGAVIVKDIPAISPQEPWRDFGHHISKHEFKRCMDHYLSSGSGPIKTLQDIVDFNEAHKDAALKHGQTVLLECLNESSGKLTEPEYIQALTLREEARHSLNKIFEDYGVDVLLCPDEETGIAPLTGFPAGTIPKDMYFITRPHDEETLIRAMYGASNWSKISTS
ncbi:MAG: amidase family protein [Defluviitaleaceae bacterium]|nr:amidase family protein [Defluviitaleaceae bacterium]